MLLFPKKMFESGSLWFFFYEFIVSLYYQYFVLTLFLIIFQNYEKWGQNKMTKLSRTVRQKNFEELWSHWYPFFRHVSLKLMVDSILNFFKLFLLALLQKRWRKKCLANNTQHLHLHCVKSIRIRSYSGLHFPAFRLNTEKYRVSLRI